MWFSSEMEIHPHGTINWLVLLIHSLRHYLVWMTCKHPNNKKMFVSVSPHYCLPLQKQRLETAHCASLSLSSCILLFASQRKYKMENLYIITGNENKKTAWYLFSSHPSESLYTKWKSTIVTVTNISFGVKNNCLMSVRDAPLNMRCQYLSMAVVWFVTLALSIKNSHTLAPASLQPA